MSAGSGSDIDGHSRTEPQTPGSALRDLYYVTAMEVSQSGNDATEADCVEESVSSPFPAQEVVADSNATEDGFVTVENRKRGSKRGKQSPVGHQSPKRPNVGAQSDSDSDCSTGTVREFPAAHPKQPARKPHRYSLGRWENGCG